MSSDQTNKDILQFFAHKTATRAQCDEYVNKNFGASEPDIIQGSQSYTVITLSNKVVQFRSDELNMRICRQAQLIYAELVPDCHYTGKIQDLSVYIAENINGTCYIGLANRHGNRNVVVDLAKFFALSWKNRITSCADSDSIRMEFHDKLTTLSTVFPESFGNLQHVLRKLGTLFTTTYPQVLSHDDLNEMNIMVDADGNIIGIINWVDARVLPFGVLLYGLENLLGHMDGEGWHYFYNHVELRALFWDIFKNEVGGISDTEMQAIMVARMAGLLMRYGFTWDGYQQVPNDADPYLHAFCLIEEAQ